MIVQGSWATVLGFSIALLVTTALQLKACPALSTRDTVFVGYRGVYTAEQIEEGELGDFMDKSATSSLSQEQQGEGIIAGRELSEFGLGPEWLNLEDLLKRLGDTEHYTTYSDVMTKDLTGTAMRAESYAHFNPPLPSEIPWEEFYVRPWDFTYVGASLLVTGHEGRVTYVSFERRLEKRLDYLSPSEITFSFGDMNLGASYSELTRVLGSPSREGPSELTLEGRSFLADMPEWYFICGESPNRTVLYVIAQRIDDQVKYVRLRFAYETTT